MKIFLVDNSTERGQRAILREMRWMNWLHSYAFVGTVTASTTWLSSLDYLESVSVDGDLPNLIIDSGAFSAFTTGKQIDVRDYARWALDFRDRKQQDFAELSFMNLDVIGDQAASWVNQEYLESVGLHPMPIVTYGASLDDLDRAIQRYDYFALGGLVPYARQPQTLAKWLNRCFARIMAYRAATGVLRRVHLLGITSDWALLKYPCYSSDSSAWVEAFRFGSTQIKGIKSNVPPYKQSDAAMSATLQSIRTRVQQLRNLEKQATDLWATRGIHWS